MFIYIFIYLLFNLCIYSCMSNLKGCVTAMCWRHSWHATTGVQWLQRVACTWHDTVLHWFITKMLSCRYRKSHRGDKAVVRSSYLHDGISYTCETISFYWIEARGLAVFRHPGTCYHHDELSSWWHASSVVLHGMKSLIYDIFSTAA